MKRLIHSILHMSPAAWKGFSATLLCCCIMAFAAYVLLLEAGPSSLASFERYRLAQELADTPAGLLLLGGIGTVILQFQK